MSDKLPLVLDLTTGGPQQLQNPDDLDIPSRKRIDVLEQQMQELAAILVDQGINVPESLTINL